MLTKVLQKFRDATILLAFLAFIFLAGAVVMIFINH